LEYQKILTISRDIGWYYKGWILVARERDPWEGEGALVDVVITSGFVNCWIILEYQSNWRFLG
jgi:hypothetical protein